uniref:HTH_Tnp_Tc3_2 domain-containing protein n=1 Tax=Caenorhabditis japonica TaxID=281687 RepID=A0A8R1ILT1_CAEJA
MDRNILRAAREDPRRTSTDIQMVVTSPVEPAPSRRTIMRRLQANGLHGRRPVRKPFISEKNRRARVAWARAHLNWGCAEWAKHIWSDESKFNMFGSDGNTWIRRPVGARYLPKYQLPTVKHGGGSCMIVQDFVYLRPINMVESTSKVQKNRYEWNFEFGALFPHLRDDLNVVCASSSTSESCLRFFQADLQHFEYQGPHG